MIVCLSLHVMVVDGCVVGCGFKFVGLSFVCLGGPCSQIRVCLCAELGVGSEDCWGWAEPLLT